MKNSISIISSPQKCQVSGVSEPIVKKQLQSWWEPCENCASEAFLQHSILHVESALAMWSGVWLCV